MNTNKLRWEESFTLISREFDNFMLDEFFEKTSFNSVLDEILTKVNHQKSILEAKRKDLISLKPEKGQGDFGDFEFFYSNLEKMLEYSDRLNTFLNRAQQDSYLKSEEIGE